jgi:flagellar assembly protein FliH
MISPSESEEGDNSLPGMPATLRDSVLRKRSVARLEFQAADRQGTGSGENAEIGSTFTMTEIRLQEQVSALEEELKLQLQQIAVQVEVAKRETRAESRAEWGEELEERVAVERARLMRSCNEFGKERTRYFADVEAEVVKLALAIAARVLHREAKLDPLLLIAVVRIALEKVADNSTTVLRVPAVEVERWREAFVAEANSEVQFVGDERLEAGECVLETNVGRVELGVKAQLDEIEKGFFDLLQQRPM